MITGSRTPVTGVLLLVLVAISGLGSVLTSGGCASEPPPPPPGAASSAQKTGGPPSASQAPAPSQAPAQNQAPAENQTSNISPEQLDSLVAPIALFQDPLLAQVLAASTYPLEIIQLHQWLAKNPNLKDKALADAVAKQPWDPSVQSMAAMRDLVKRLADDIQ